MSIDPARLVEIINDCGYDVRPYSGRGMFGRQCVGVDTDEGLLGTISNLIANCDDVDEASEVARRAKADSMGLGMIIYWPCARWQEAAEPEGDEAA